MQHKIYPKEDILLMAGFQQNATMFQEYSICCENILLVREENPGAFLPPCPIYHNHDEVTPFIL
jgi:hypothetical protein